ncbi:unnamed protein product, partial [Cyprideis torosa]
MSEEEVRFYHEEHVYGWEFVTFTCESTRMISYYLEKWPDIKVFKRKIDSLDEITNAIGKNPPIDTIVNCAGLGARDIVNDRNLVPIRGQLVKVTAPWIQKALLLDEYPDQPQRCTYVIPNITNVGVGGTIQKGNENLEKSDEDEEYILKRAKEAVLSLKDAKIQRHWVGLRPGRRGGIRVELDENFIRSDGSNVKVKHDKDLSNNDSR